MTIERDVRQAIAELEMISHVSAAQPGGQGHDESEDIGGRRPPGGVDYRDDRDPDNPHKSAEHFKRRAAKARSERALLEIEADARKTLEAWRHQPPPQDPEWGSFQWRRQIAQDIRTGTRSVDAARQFYSVSRATIYRYLAQFG